MTELKSISNLSDVPVCSWYFSGWTLFLLLSAILDLFPSSPFPLCPVDAQSCVGSLGSSPVFPVQSHDLYYGSCDHHWYRHRYLPGHNAHIPLPVPLSDHQVTAAADWSVSQSASLECSPSSKCRNIGWCRPWRRSMSSWSRTGTGCTMARECGRSRWTRRCCTLPAPSCMPETPHGDIVATEKHNVPTL